MTTLLLIATLAGAEPTLDARPAEPTVEDVGGASRELDVPWAVERYEKNMRVSRTGMYVGLGGVVAMVGGGLVFFTQCDVNLIFGTTSCDSGPTAALGGVGLVGGAFAVIGGGIATTAGSLSAAYNLRSQGTPVSTAPGWIGLGGWLILGSPSMYLGSGIQMVVNQHRYLDSRGEPRRKRTAVQPWFDVRRRRLGLSGTF